MPGSSPNRRKRETVAELVRRRARRPVRRVPSAVEVYLAAAWRWVVGHLGAAGEPAGRAAEAPPLTPDDPGRAVLQRRKNPPLSRGWSAAVLVPRAATTDEEV